MQIPIFHLPITNYTNLKANMQLMKNNYSDHVQYIWIMCLIRNPSKINKDMVRATKFDL